MADLVKALRAGMKLQAPDNRLTADIMGDAAERIEQLEAALAWGERLYTGYSLLAQFVEGVSSAEGPGAWINRVRELLREVGQP